MKKIVLGIASISIIIIAIAQKKKPTPKKIDTPVASIERGHAIYKKECMSCHQEDGGGVPHLNPPLNENQDINNDKKKIISIVLKGMSDRVPIEGEYYSNSMASHAYLSNQEIADVLSYIRNSFGNNASPITADEVKAVRVAKKK